MFNNLTIKTIQYINQYAIDIVFIGDGFLSTDLIKYDNKVNDAVNALFNKSPFDNNLEKFNIYSIPTISNESGISTINHPSNPTTEDIKDTFLGSYRNKSGLIRFTDFTKKEELKEYLTNIFFKKIYLCVISNTSFYGGSGEFPDNNIMPTTHVMLDEQYNTFGNLFVHEFGHSFGGLADEYGGNCTGIEDGLDEILYDRGNVTNDIVNDRKWDYLESPLYIPGANYCDTDWYRSSQSSLMRGWFEGFTNEDEEFNQVSKDIIVDRINEDIESNKGIINNRIITKSFKQFKLPINYNLI